MTMPDRPKDPSSTEFVDETLNLFRIYSQNRENWAKHAKEDKEFRLGRQWTQKQEDILNARGQAPIVVNRIHPAVEAAKSMLTANRPSFRVAPREDSDNKVAHVLSSLLSYMYDISDGVSVVRRVVDDYYTMGVGYINVYQNPMMDMGKGEVCIHDIDPMDVYVDPNCRSKFFDDAENVIVSRMFTKEQAVRMYPMYEKAIRNASSDQRWDTIETGRATNDFASTFPEDVRNIQEQEYVRGYERYYKMMVERYRIYEAFSDKEDLLDADKFKMYMEQPAWILNGEKVLTNGDEVEPTRSADADADSGAKNPRGNATTGYGQRP